MAIRLIADSGSTKAEWCLINGKTKKTFVTQGLSPYFLSAEQIEYIMEHELRSKMKKVEPDEVFFYGTGCSNPDNTTGTSDRETRSCGRNGPARPVSTALRSIMTTSVKRGSAAGSNQSP